MNCNNDTAQPNGDMGVNGRTTHIVVGAVHDGDAQFRETAAIVHFYVPANNPNGAQQTITFPTISVVPTGTKTIRLNATVNSPLPVRYYVLRGPAEVDGNNLRLTEIPVRATFPIEVKVTAYQWGKATAPAYASATPVMRTFLIVGKNAK